MGAAGSGPTFRSVCWPSCSVGFRLCSIALLSSFLALRDHGVSADELEEVVAEELERPSPGQLVGGEPSLSRVAPNHLHVHPQQVRYLRCVENGGKILIRHVSSSNDVHRHRMGARNLCEGGRGQPSTMMVPVIEGWISQK